MEYGYVRVSSRDQNIARQMDGMRRFGIQDKSVFIDYQSGKDFERKNYRRLIRTLRKGDLLVIKSIDRLGRDYQAIIDEWRKITKEIGADIVVLDMPLLDTRKNGLHGLVGHFIGDVVLQILSFVAENERANIRERQTEGIRLAKERGVRFGRPRKPLPNGAGNILADYKAHRMNCTEASEKLGISQTTFFKILSEAKAREEKQTGTSKAVTDCHCPEESFIHKLN
jgi:Site-specific recombinases, DNA invertase Pin homologs